MTTIPTLETDRLRLRPYRISDAAPYAKHIFSDRDVMRYMTANGKLPFMPKFQAEQLIQKRLRQWQDHGFGGWIIESCDEGFFMGYSGLFIINDTELVEIGYALAKPFWGKGYATEAARLVLRYAFETAKLDRVEAVVAEANMPSLRVMEKIGMQKCGLMDEFYDVELIQYELTREMYLSSQTS